MKEIEDRLRSIVSSLDDLNDILVKSKSNNDNISDTMLFKNIEDGILNSIDNANNKQLNYIMDGYRFKFYTEYNKDKELLRSRINGVLREKKLNKVLKDEKN